MTSHVHSTVTGGREGTSKDIPLSSLPSRSSSQRVQRARKDHLRRQPHSLDDDEELDPESTPALLRKHFHDSSSDDDAEQDNTKPYLNPLKRFLGLMSKTPLLLRSAPGFGTGSYGAAPVGQSTENSEEENEEFIRRQKRKKASGLRNAISSGTMKATGSNGERNRTGRRRSIPIPGSESVEPLLGDEVGLDKSFGVTGLPILSDDEDSGSTQEPDEAYTDDGSSINLENPPDNSPYAQVRASVSAIDNTTLSINTPRMWFLSLLFAILGSSTNLFFSLRYPSVSITPVIALLLVHPLGLMWDQILKRREDPEETFVDGARVAKELDPDELQKPASSMLRNFRLWLGQGRWNEKEHSCVYISSNVSFGFAFATDVIVEQTHFYNQKVGIPYQLLLTLSTQILGYAFAGLTRRFLVRPGGMIWPGTLMSAAMFTTLHKEENSIANGWKITRWKFFFVVWLSSFVFYFIPGLLAPALSNFNVITWFAPQNVVIANLFGTASGLGLFPVTFDWAQIAYIGSPLVTPFWAAMNVVGGLVIVMWIIAPIMYYKNYLFSSYMPILSSLVFDNTGQQYDVSKILTKDFLFDREAYHNYSRVYMPITYVLSYGLQFAALASLLTHTACWHGKDIWRQWKRSLKEAGDEGKGTYQAVPGAAAGGVFVPRRLQRSDSSNLENIISQEDVHNRLMKRYKDAPGWWYLATFVSMLAVGIFVVE